MRLLIFMTMVKRERKCKNSIVLMIISMPICSNIQDIEDLKA